MDEMQAPDLADLCGDLAGQLDEVTSTADGGVINYHRGEAAFARASTSTLEVRLPADIAEAALRTPDTTPADERGWIRFSPKDDAQHVADRATAWFQTAWRHAGDR